jgi:hypothetical protein
LQLNQFVRFFGKNKKKLDIFAKMITLISGFIPVHGMIESTLCMEDQLHHAQPNLIMENAYATSNECFRGFVSAALNVGGAIAQHRGFAPAI